MNKNIIIKSIAALTILTSITGVGTTVVDGIQQTAKAENSVKLITNTNVAPYSGVTWMGAGRGFVVGNHTIITNKHVTYHMKSVMKSKHILMVFIITVVDFIKLLRL